MFKTLTLALATTTLGFGSVQTANAAGCGCACSTSAPAPAASSPAMPGMAMNAAPGTQARRSYSYEPSMDTPRAVAPSYRGSTRSYAPAWGLQKSDSRKFGG